MWLFLAVGSALFYAIEQIFNKRLSNERGIFSASWMMQGFSLPFIAAIVFFYGTYMHLASLPWQFWWPLLLIWVVLYPVQTYFYVRSLREGEASHVLPIMSALPVFNIIVSWFLLHEKPSIYGILGILSICAAVFMLLLPKGKHPFKVAHYSRAGFFMIIFCACVAFGASFDKVALHVSDPLFYSFMNKLGGTIALFVMMHVMDRTKKDELTYIKKNVGFVFVVGLVQALAFGMYILALTKGFVSYTLAIQTSSIVIAAFLGFWLYREKITTRKAISLLFIVLGLALLAVA